MALSLLDPISSFMRETGSNIPDADGVRLRQMLTKLAKARPAPAPNPCSGPFLCSSEGPSGALLASVSTGAEQKHSLEEE